MRLTLLLSTALAQTALAAIIPLQGTVSTDAYVRMSVDHKEPKNIPLIIWHGLGDSYDSDGMQGIADLYQQMYPSSQVYVVHLGDSGSADRQASFFGNLTEHVNTTCNEIKAHPKLAKASATNALGFSQGGVFLRALVERCNIPRTKNLVTFGSPHNGINTFADCADTDWLCQLWSGTLRSNTWGDFTQGHLVPAQYFRDPEDVPSYLNYSNFLADINNERKKKSNEYAKNIAGLDSFIMYNFEEEDVIHPPPSTWFAEFNKSTEKVTYLKDRALYKEDWLGLKKLDSKGGLHFRTTKGKHMRIEPGVLEDVFSKDFAPLASEAGLAETPDPRVKAKEDQGQRVLALDSQDKSPASDSLRERFSKGLPRCPSDQIQKAFDEMKRERRWRFVRQFLKFFREAMEGMFV